MSENRSIIRAILKRARDRIESGWTQHCMARDINRCPTRPYDSDAVCWCLSGAIVASRVEYFQDDANLLSYLEHDVREAAMWQVAKQLDFEGVATWNDMPGRTQAEVVAILNKAIANV